MPACATWRDQTQGELHPHPLNHAVIYIVLTMDDVPCLDLIPPYQVASAQLTLLENDAKKVNAEDTWGVELIFDLSCIMKS